MKFIALLALIASLAVSIHEARATSLTGHSVGGEISPGKVVTAMLADGAVDTAKTGADSVTTAKLLTGAVDTNKLAADSVTTSKLITGAVDTNKLATDSVTSASILNGTIARNDLAASIIDSTKLAATFIDVKTKAQLAAATPAFGQLALCIDCSAGPSICIGTATLGATVNAWAKVYSGTVDTTKSGCGTGQ